MYDPERKVITEPATPVDLLRAATDGAWEEVDTHIGNLAVGRGVKALAQDWLRSDVSAIRDLGASIFEVRTDSLTPEAVEALTDVMLRGQSIMAEHNPDDEGFDSFRAACALFVHGHTDDPNVVAVLANFANNDDPEVAEIAQGYLDKLTPSN